MNDDLENVYVVDTCVLLEDPDVVHKLRQCTIVIPVAVVKELDGLKLSAIPKKAQTARRASRNLDKLGSHQNFPFGTITVAGSVVKIFFGHTKIDDFASCADNKILGAALRLKKDNKHSNVVVLTNDCNMRIIARAYGIAATSYPLVSVN